MIKELQLRLLPEEAANEQALARGWHGWLLVRQRLLLPR